MASSSDRKLNSSASRASKPTFRRAGGQAVPASQKRAVRPAGAIKPVAPRPVNPRKSALPAKTGPSSARPRASAARPVSPKAPVASKRGTKRVEPAQMARSLKQPRPRTFASVPGSGKAAPASKRPVAGSKDMSRIARVLGVVAGAFAALLVIGIIVVNSGLFAANDIQIKGSEHITKHDAVQLIDIPEGTSLFNVDTAKIVDDLKQNPWISGVDVVREFPHTLVITPTERKVLAIAYITSDDIAWAIGDDDSWIAPLSTSVAVDDTGDLVTSGEGANTLNGIDAALALAKHYGAVLLTDVPADVDPVSGQGVSSKTVKAGLDYARGFSSDFLSQVKDISVSSTEAISANLDSGVEVSLGAADDIAKKERIVTKLLSQVEGVTYINVRSTGNYTFRNAPAS